MNNKNRTDSYIPDAIEALTVTGIAKNGKVDSSYRGQISSFGAAVTIGSFKQAVAFFAQDAKNGASKISRSDLILAIDYILNKDNYELGKNKTIDNKKDKVNHIKEDILKMTDPKLLKSLENRYLDAAVALKVAMGVYDMKSENEKDKREKEE